MLSLEPIGYTYRAEQFCPNCTIEALKAGSMMAVYDDSSEATIRVLANLAGIDYSEPTSYDSDDFPKPILSIDLDCGSAADDPHDPEYHEHCDACGGSLCD